VREQSGNHELQLEKTAHGKDNLMHHGKDAHAAAGNQSHFQSRGQRGHTFYTGVSAFAATTYFGDGFIFRRRLHWQCH